MYEFSKKEVRQKFKKTEYGQKTNTWLMLSSFAAIISLITCICLTVLASGENVELSFTSEMLLVVLKTITFICLITMCYFDGKRDGAIEQFKIKNK